MVFVKQVRLCHARRMLITSNETTSVMSVAFDCGFSNLDHFTNAFRQVISITHQFGIEISRNATHRPQG